MTCRFTLPLLDRLYVKWPLLLIITADFFFQSFIKFMRIIINNIIVLTPAMAVMMKHRLVFFWRGGNRCVINERFEVCV